MSVVFFIFFVIFGFWNILYGELIPVNNGLGWDGGVYGAIAMNFYQKVFIDPIAYYHVQRILPSGIVSSILGILHWPHSTENIILIFKIYNLVLILGSIFIWRKIIKIFELNFLMSWVAYVCLYFNYFILKQSFYYPVLTDTTAFFISVMMFYAYLVRNSWGIFALTILGSFVWPVCLYFGLILYVFTYSKHDLEDVNKHRSVWGALIAVLISIFFIGRAIYLSLSGTLHAFLSNTDISPIDESVVYLSIGAVGVYLFLGLNCLLRKDSFIFIKKSFTTLSMPKIIVSILLLLALFRFVNYVGDYKLNFEAYFVIDSVFIYSSILKPFISILGHIVFYGPVILITIFCWRQICDLVIKKGLGLNLFFIFSFLLTICSDPRHSLFFYPFVVIFTIKALQELKPSVAFVLCFTFFSILFSKVWLKLNSQPFSGSYFDFPYQWYFFNYGVLMSNFSYYLQGSIVILVGGILFVVFLWTHKNHQQSRG